MHGTPTRFSYLVRLLATLLPGVLLGALLLAGCSDSPDQDDIQAAAQPTPGVYYVCPMGDVPPLPLPGDCPVCGMELVPRQAAPEGPDTGKLTLTPAEQQAAGIVTAPVTRQLVERTVRLYGQVEYDPGYYTELDAFTSGVIDEVFVRRTGAYIRPDQELFAFYSAEIYAMELELLEIMRSIPDYVAAQIGAIHPSEQGYVGRLGRTRESGSQVATRGRGLVPNIPTAPPPGREPRSIRPIQPGQPGQTGQFAQPGQPEKSGPPEDLAVAPEPEAESAKPTLTDDEIRDLERRFATIRFRLRSYGLYDRDINKILRLEEPVGIITVRVPTMTSTVGGILIENNALQGRFVNSGTPLMLIADPHFIWASFRAFEADYAWLRLGQQVSFEAVARPGETYHGVVTLLEPTFDAKTRTFRVGVSYTDSRNLLRPNMLVRAEVKARIDTKGNIATDRTPPDRWPLVIPASAPLITGRRAVVFVAMPGEPGTPRTFEPRDVVLGPRADDTYVVLEGLFEGEQVVVNGSFKLDSELQIQARPSMLHPQGIPGYPAAAEGMENMEGMQGDTGTGPVNRWNVPGDADVVAPKPLPNAP